MKLVNTSSRDMAIPTQIETTILKPNEFLVVSKTELEQLKRDSQIRNWLHRGMLSTQSGGNTEHAADKPKEEKSDLPEGVTGKGVEIVEHKGGWFSVHVDGMPCTDKKVRKDQADEIAADYA